MKLQKTNSILLIKNCFPERITAGFTSNSFDGISENLGCLLRSQEKKVDGVAHLNQIHSHLIHTVDSPCFLKGDGLFTNSLHLLLVVKTADCLPLFFYSERLQIAGLIHMGWKPAKSGILENIPFNLSSFQVIAGVGLRKCCYEVGKEFIEIPCFKLFLSQIGSSLFLDPIAFAKATLMKNGLKAENFHDLGLCSFCSNSFPSYRKHKNTLRTLSFILME